MKDCYLLWTHEPKQKGEKKGLKVERDRLKAEKNASKMTFSMPSYYITKNILLQHLINSYFHYEIFKMQ